VKLRHTLLLAECIGYATVALALYGLWSLVEDLL
jgi:hypothetical protein